jgi:hypothetical protein
MYERWSVRDRRHNLELERQLAAAYRAAWRSGDEHDRFLALHFVFDKREVAGFDLVVEGLNSDDFSLARTAAAICLSLIEEGRDMGPNVRRALEEFGDRFPDAEVFAWFALQALDERERSD